MSDLNVQTAEFGTRLLIVGTEAATLVWSQTVAENTGWVRNRALHTHHIGTDISVETSGTDGTESHTEKVYLAAGTYESWLRMHIDSYGGNADTNASLNGTAISAGAAGTSTAGGGTSWLVDWTTAGIVIAADSWVNITYTATCDGATYYSQIHSAAVWLRQTN